MKKVLQTLLAALAIPTVVAQAAPVETQTSNPLTATLPIPLIGSVSDPLDSIRGTLVRLASTEATREALLAAVTLGDSLVNEVCMGVSADDRESLIGQISSIRQTNDTPLSENQVTIPVIVTLRNAMQHNLEELQDLAGVIEPLRFSNIIEELAILWDENEGPLSEFLSKIVETNDLVQKFIYDLVKLTPIGNLIPPTVAPGDPTDAPTDAPTDPTEAPTDAPTDPTEAPTVDPTEAPTDAPTDPTDAPTDAPTDPTEAPTDAPVDPTDAPTIAPVDPTDAPTIAPVDPTDAPTVRRLQEVGTFIIPTEFLPQDFSNILGMFSQLTSPAQSVLPFGNFQGEDVVVSQQSPSDESNSAVLVSNPLNFVEFVSGPMELLSSPLKTLMGLFDPLLSFFTPSQLAALMPLGESMTSSDLLSAFSFENLLNVFSPELITTLPLLVDSPDDEVLESLTPEALANANEEGSPFARILDRARETGKQMANSSDFLAPAGQSLLPTDILSAGAKAPIALFNILGSNAFNDALQQLAVETNSS